MNVPLEEKRLMRRLDGRILPIACLMYPFTREFPITVLLCQYLHALYLSIEGSPARSVSGTFHGDLIGVLLERVPSVFYFSYVRRSYRELVAHQ